MKRVLVVNNRDSFVYNLVEYLRHLVGKAIDICTVEQLYTGEWRWEYLLSYSHILLSPGAGVPSEYPQMMRLLGDVIHEAKEGNAIPILLGVCLGHQAIAVALGAELTQMENPKHGHSSRLIQVDPTCFLWNGVTKNSEIARYHSWVIDKLSIPEVIDVLAYDNEMNIMAISHRKYPIYGFQFHPESIITKSGFLMLKAWIKQEPLLKRDSTI